MYFGDFWLTYHQFQQILSICSQTCQYSPSSKSNQQSLHFHTFYQPCILQVRSDPEKSPTSLNCAQKSTPYKQQHRKTPKITQMSQQPVKLRDRLPSEAVTAVEQLPEDTLNSASIKPHDDPDAPPDLQLQKQNESSAEGESTPLEQEEAGRRLQRPRAKSEDGEYTILGFLEQKIRVRLMSVEFGQKIDLMD